MAKATTGKKNSNLRKAAKVKQDEFYTQLSDIENELKHYREHFKGKVVYCNCDDPKSSNFFTYFSQNFKQLGLKKLITTCYKSEDANGRSKNASKQALYLEYPGGGNSNIKKYPLKGDGDFRSDECVELLNQADIVVTNPPFSLFREYVAQLIEHDKKFLIIGSQNNVICKEIFNLLKENKLWLGYGNGAMSFKVPDTYTGTCEGTPGNKQAKLGNICWYTNLDITKRNEDIILYKEYNPKEYPKYDNYDAINVNKIKDIPMDYDGVMGVPITIFSNHNPEQVEILGLTNTGEINEGIRHKDTPHGRALVSGKEVYTRILIRRVK
jgi:hypothetical protein